MHFSIPSKYLRLSGWALLIGGLMGFSGQLLHVGDVPESFEQIQWFLARAMNTHIWLAYATLLILIGLPAIYLRQAANLKWWGWLSLPLLFTGMFLEIFHGPVQILAYPALFSTVKSEADLQVVSSAINNLAVDVFPQQLLVLVPLLPFLFAGLGLLAVAVLRARVYPRVHALFIYLTLLIAVVYFVLPVKIWFLEVSFAYFHLIFVLYGATLAFDKALRPAKGESFTTAA